MGQIVDGKWTTENVLFNHNEKGLYFKRDSVFRARIESDPKSEFPAEPGRYHLYCAVACPWAHRTTLMRTLKKLEPFVSRSPAARDGRSEKRATSCPVPTGAFAGCTSSTRSPIRPAPRG